MKFESNFTAPISETPEAMEHVGEVREIEFGQEGKRLKGRIYFPETQKPNMPTVLIVHGWRGDQLGKSKICALASAPTGYAAMTFDMRGHGQTPGDLLQLTFQDFMDDIKAAFDELAHTPGIDPNNITLVSTSFSSYLAALLTRERPVRNLVLRSPGNYRDEDVFGANAHIPAADLVEKRRAETYAWRLLPQGYENNSALAALHDFKGDVLLVAAGNDEYVPTQTTANFANAVEDKTHLTTHVIEGASHGLKEEASVADFTKVLSNWIAQEKAKSSTAAK